MLIRNANVIFPDKVIGGCSILVRGKRIAAVGTNIACGPDEEIIEAKDYYLAPGFIDLHLHLGHQGPDFPPEREFKDCSVNLPGNGTTRFCATLSSALKGDLPQFFSAIRNFLSHAFVGAKPVGVHLEGPYIAKEAAGGFDPNYITTPAEFSLDDILDEGADLVRIVTLSPELPGAVEVIRNLVRRGIVASMGHTWAGLEEYQAARNAGAAYCCHTYNNRRTFPDSPKGGRAFTLDDLAVADDEVTCELICDGVHVKPVWIKTIYRTKGQPGGICLVTDSFLAGKRITEGVFYPAGGKKIVIRDGVCRNEDGGLCGSVCTQDRAVKIFMETTGASLSEAVRCASLNPARAIGIEDQFGSITEGKQADLVLLDEKLTPILTLVDGQIAYDRRVESKERKQ